MCVVLSNGWLLPPACFLFILDLVVARALQCLTQCWGTDRVPPPPILLTHSSLYPVGGVRETATAGQPYPRSLWQCQDRQK